MSSSSSLSGFCSGLLTLCLSSSAPLAAHDFWIEPSTWSPAPNELVRLTLCVGDGFVGEPVAREEGFLRRFVALAAGLDDALPVRGFEGQSPAGFVRLPARGVHVLGYESRPRAVELEPLAFSRYLIEEGLESILERRLALGEGDQPGRERFVRCAKALLCSGPHRPADCERRLGLTLELVPLGDPFASGELELLLLARGEPLVGALVVALASHASEGAARKPVGARSDAAGRVRLTLDGPGTWLVSAVHMVRVADPKEGAAAGAVEGLPAADWESYWASLAFRRTAPQAH